MEDTKLKPCPFCGGEAELKQTGKNQLTIKCKRCLIKRVQSVLRLSIEWLEVEMIEHWNKRVDKKCDAMGHFGAPPRHGICPRCNKPF